MSDNLTITRESPWLSAAYDFLPTITGPRPDSSQATMNPRLADVWVQPSRYKVLYGGRGSSKTWETAAHAIRIAQAARVRILCTRQFQSKIEDSVYTTIARQIERFQLQDAFDIQNNRILCKTTKSEFLFYGIARNIAEIKGLEGVDIMWLEEAEAVSEDDFRLLSATIRQEGSEIWVIFNPRFDQDFVYQHMVVNPPPNSIVRKVNWDDNPFISKTLLEEIIDLMVTDPEEYEHQYLGVPKTDNDLVMIKRSWLESCKNAHIRFQCPLSGTKRIGFDIADDGSDKNATCLAHGNVVRSCATWKGLEDKLLESCSRVWEYARLENASIDFDCIGVGASAGNKFKELNEEHAASTAPIVFRKFSAGASVIYPEKQYKDKVKNKDHFENRKAQSWMEVADRARETHAMVKGQIPFDPSRYISFDSEAIGEKECDALFTELSTPFRDHSKSGKVMLETKKELRKRHIKSTNRADAAVMALGPITVPAAFDWYVTGLAA